MYVHMHIHRTCIHRAAIPKVYVQPILCCLLESPIGCYVAFKTAGVLLVYPAGRPVICEDTTRTITQALIEGPNIVYLFIF